MTEAPFDCAVIGAGPAGITVARKLAQANLKVALLEGGGRETTLDSQALYEGSASGLPYDLGLSRLRYFGGTSGHWTGMCRPLDREDYAPRRDIGRTAWPFDGAELRPYWPEVCDILDLPAKPQWRPRRDDVDPADIKAQESAGLREIYWTWSPARFGDKYWPEISASPNISLFLNTTAISFTADGPNGSAIRSVECRDTVTGEAKSIAARLYVLSCGGVENARTLLFSNALNGTAHGNTGGLLGVGFMEHPHVRVGSFVGFKPFNNPPGNLLSFRYFKTLPAFQKKHGVLNSAIRLLYGGKFEREDFAQWKFSLPEPVTGGEVFVVSEQEPAPGNAITLTAERDRLGVPMVNLDLRLSERDSQTISASARAIAEYLVYSQSGRARIDLTIPIQPGEHLLFGNHHMGATRMGKDERKAVVDENGLVFGTQNLFVAGSSLFPTSGHANPTFTIVSLALRLSEHLKTYKA
jgi:choline dehydrogenase-like flavoprotein